MAKTSSGERVSNAPRAPGCAASGYFAPAGSIASSKPSRMFFVPVLASTRFGLTRTLPRAAFTSHAVSGINASGGSSAATSIAPVNGKFSMTLSKRRNEAFRPLAASPISSVRWGATGMSIPSSGTSNLRDVVNPPLGPAVGSKPVTVKSSMRIVRLRPAARPTSTWSGAIDASNPFNDSASRVTSIRATAGPQSIAASDRTIVARRAFIRDLHESATRGWYAPFADCAVCGIDDPESSSPDDLDPRRPRARRLGGRSFESSARAEPGGGGGDPRRGEATRRGRRARQRLGDMVLPLPAGVSRPAPRRPRPGAQGPAARSRLRRHPGERGRNEELLDEPGGRFSDVREGREGRNVRGWPGTAMVRGDPRDVRVRRRRKARQILGGTGQLPRHQE